MTHLRPLLRRTFLAAALAGPLAAVPAADAEAELSIRFGSGGFSGHHHRGGPRNGYRHHPQPRYSHGVPFLSRKHSDYGTGVRTPHRAPTHGGFGSRPLPPLQCAPARRGGGQLCGDSFGRPYYRPRAQF